jgi:threonine dehydrogenase-like Zn-dependent dehydrogenase
LGIRNHNGAFAQYLTLPAANLHLVPPEVPDEAAVFTEPLAAALRVAETAPISPEDRILVEGDGYLGLQTAWVLALNGAQVTLAGHHPEHLALAAPYGVTACLEPDLPPGDYQVVVEASGSPGGLRLALSRVRPLGAVILKSTYTDRFPLDPAEVVVPEVRLVGSRCGPFAAALKLLARGGVDHRPLIARTFPLSQAVAALDWARRPGVLKVLLDCR